MVDILEERIRRLRLMGESAKRRSNLYSGISGLDDKKTVKSLGALKSHLDHDSKFGGVIK